MNRISIVLIISAIIISSSLFGQNVGQMKDDTIVNFIDINNKKQGKWVKYYDSGKMRYKGFFINDIPTGTFTYYHPNSKIKSILNYDDKGCCTSEIYWENGNRAAKGFYDENQKRDKVWNLYFDDGVLSAVINYSHGVAHGAVQMFYPESGQKVLDCGYADGKLDGYYKKFFKTGTTMEEGPYVKGSRHGYWKFYTPEGIVDEEGPYVDGRKHGDWIYRKDNAPADTVNFVMDKADNYDEMMEEWRGKQEWAKQNQHLFKQPEDYLDNPIDFFKPNTNPDTQLK
jgi:antitoxin component YwqK of YwqJK toxin-antitoxin module